MKYLESISTTKVTYYTAINTETDELMVVYQAEYGERKIFVRPLIMFLEMVLVDGQEIPRFRKIED